MVQTRSQSKKCNTKSIVKQEIIQKDECEPEPTLRENNCRENVQYNILALIEHYNNNYHYYDLQERFSKTRVIFNLVQNPYVSESLLNNTNLKKVMKDKLIEFHFHYKNETRYFYQTYRNLFKERMPMPF